MSAHRRVSRTADSPFGIGTWSELDSREFLAQHLARADLAELGELLQHCSLLLGDQSVSLEEITDFRTAAQALARASRQIRAALCGDARAADTVMGAASLEDLARRIADAERVIGGAEVAYLNRSMRAAREALRQLEGATAVGDLTTVAPAAIASIGFDRTLLSHIEQTTWLTDAAHVQGDAEWADLIVSAGRAAPEQMLPGLPETDLVRRQKPIVVTSVRQRTHVHQAIAEASAARSYVAAPIVVRSDVVGFIHADRCYHRGDVSEFDAEVVGVFAQGYSFALERAIALRDIEELRSRAWSFATGIDALVGHADARVAMDTGNDRGTRQPSWSASGRPRLESSSAIDDLTRRELQVLDRMAVGEGNHAIARKLVISEETVKSHVKNILRKLGATNRVEAVAVWHAAQSGGIARQRRPQA